MQWIAAKGMEIFSLLIQSKRTSIPDRPGNNTMKYYCVPKSRFDTANVDVVVVRISIRAVWRAQFALRLAAHTGPGIRL